VWREESWYRLYTQTHDVSSQNSHTRYVLTTPDAKEECDVDESIASDEDLEGDTGSEQILKLTTSGELTDISEATAQRLFT